MISLRESAYALYGAYRLARFDRAGVSYFDTTLQGFWNSFYAALFVAPFFLVLIFTDYALGRVGEDLFRFVSVQTIAYVIGWVLFPLAMVGIARTIDREERYLGYIVAYNWISVLQNALYTPVAIALAGTGLAITPVGLIAFVVLGYVLVYTWFVTRVALDVPSGIAVMVVVVDVALSLLMNGVTESMIDRPVAGAV